MSQIAYLNETGSRAVFQCPGCQCGHEVRVKAEGKGEPWGWNGSLDAPTFTPSILTWWNDAGREKRCHSFVTDGKIQFLHDSTHALAGHTVPLQPW